MKVLLLALLLLPGIAHACRCATGAPFEEASQGKPLIIHARVLEYGDVLGDIPTSMTVEVVRVIKGEARGARMKVWGDPGNLCRPYVTRFPIGTEWLLALDARSAISICGVHWQRVGHAPPR